MSTEAQTSRKNELSLKRLKVHESYARHMRNVEALLNEFRSLVGYTLASASVIDLREIEPSVRVTVQRDCDEVKFELDEGDQKVLEKKPKEEGELRQRRKQVEMIKKVDVEEEEPTRTVFKPFGLLEPRNAKIARQNMKSVIPLLFELANIQQEIRALLILDDLQ